MNNSGNNEVSLGKIPLEQLEDAELNAMIALEDGDIAYDDYKAVIEHIKSIKVEMGYV